MEFAVLVITLSTSAPVFSPFQIQARMPLVDDFGVFPLEHSPTTLISNLFLIVCVQNVDQAISDFEILFELHLAPIQKVAFSCLAEFDLYLCRR